MRISISDTTLGTSDNDVLDANCEEETMSRKQPAKTLKRRRTPYGVNRDRTSVQDLWKEMWEGTGESNRRLRWRRWDRDLDFN
jgi:hypothetical protein